MFTVPRYGQASLSDLFPSLLAGLGIPGETDRLGLGLDARRVCVLLIDGLGSEQLAEHADIAPFLASADPRSLTAGFPTTTTTSLTSLGVGVPPGEHGLVGYLLRVPGHDRLMTPLKWGLFGAGPKVDLLKELSPEEFQPRATVFERAAAAGVAVTQVGPIFQAGSGLTRAAFRGSDFRFDVSMGDLVDGALTALRQGDRSLVYAYHADLDTTGHVRGPGSPAWKFELTNVDRAAQAIAERLPADAALLVTADHGMVEVDERIDFDTDPALADGVGDLGGEPRARHVYTLDGAAPDVAAAWSELLGDRFDVVLRADAIQRGWFGPAITPESFDRIGDLVVVARQRAGIVRSAVEPLQSGMVGHHGSLTSAEMHVPLLVFRP
ncbi:alkaline phosphatase family protein [Nocardia otitidiscaviarum]|uniref:alkaline phosphatase family protein n=1 Tax=Nocardia otitidiscaviarum TaxID=1823 RepID=UPI0018942C3B|nr:alkaline phosphatase family protein [Nocardia otitidiscaviarum]MBF6239756.1 alkaline phosphatase family protein [Nocardia otitidiscaviarum]